MHFTINLEYYFKNSALTKCCQDLSAKLQGLQRPKTLRSQPSSLIHNYADSSESAAFNMQDKNIDMDELIKLHKNFQNQVLRRCMLDHSLRHFKRELNNAMDNVLEFRRICKKYFLCKVPGDNEDSDDEMLYGAAGTGTGKYRGSRLRRYEKEGMGLLKVGNADFM